jgi:murein DD-endopeptidase MepM/ murein hydrolase activator NlpD
MGPMQFLAGTWSAYGVDGDGDGRADVYDSTDAIWGAARYLCANGAGNMDTLRSALWAYNHSDSYVDQVLRAAASYASEPTTQTGHTLPLSRTVFEQHPGYLTAPHHDYPAIDVPVPVGTAVYAAAGGTVALSSADVGICGGTITIDATDGARYTYCHLSSELVGTGARVDTGAQIALSGGQPDAPGAGDATGPHLHLGITVNGTTVCPQALLTAWSNGEPMDPNSAPVSGCSY